MMHYSCNHRLHAFIKEHTTNACSEVTRWPYVGVCGGGRGAASHLAIMDSFIKSTEGESVRINTWKRFKPSECVIRGGKESLCGGISKHGNNHRQEL